jgi:hypothetical protein
LAPGEATPLQNVECHFYPSSQGEDAGFGRRVQSSVEKQHRHNRLTLVAGSDHPLQLGQLGLGGIAIAGYAVELEQELRNTLDLELYATCVYFADETGFPGDLFTRLLGDYLTDESYRKLQRALMENPEMGDLMPGMLRDLTQGGLAHVHHGATL